MILRPNLLYYNFVTSQKNLDFFYILKDLARKMRFSKLLYLYLGKYLIGSFICSNLIVSYVHYKKLTGKKEWPELVGIEYSIAARIIERENPHVKAQKIIAGSPRIMNYNPGRVWVDVNVENKCVLIPKAG